MGKRKPISELLAMCEDSPTVDGAMLGPRAAQYGRYSGGLTDSSPDGLHQEDVKVPVSNNISFGEDDLTESHDGLADELIQIPHLLPPGRVAT